MNKFLKYGFGAIGVYLAVVFADGASKDAQAGGGAIATIVSAFQGRAANVATSIPKLA